MNIDFNSDKLQEECGVIGCWSRSGTDAAHLLFLGLFGIQHRGQQSAGIAIIDKSRIIYHKELGLASSHIDEVVIRHLSGSRAGVGHVGYLTGENVSRENAGPFVMRYKKGQMAISYNGCLMNAKCLRAELENDGFIFQSNSDAELIGAMIGRERLRQHSIEDAVLQVMKRLKGSYALLILTPNKFLAVRDGYGMKPLCMGKLGDTYIFASESVAFDTVGAEFVRDITPGEIVVLDDMGIRYLRGERADKTAMCIFEFVYFARTDSVIDGAGVHLARFEAGKTLAKECPVDADVVIGVPDSGLSAAMGYSFESNIPYTIGIVKNRYITRTFIQPAQEERELAVGLKLNAIRSSLEGKRVVLVDDSIVRGTTSKKIVDMLRVLGRAKEIHVRISSPMVKYSCHYGIDTHDVDTLIANKMNNDEIARFIGADSLGFISGEGLLASPQHAKCSFCSACFDGRYPMPFEDGDSKHE